VVASDQQTAAQDTPIPGEEATDEERLRVLLEQISSYIEHYHGGSVEMVSYDGKTLKVRLGGACLGCPLLPSTLHGWVEGTVKQFFPQIIKVESVTE
jgi:Fe-S cluster biogenesis protein NfuA